MRSSGFAKWPSRRHCCTIGRCNSSDRRLPFSISDLIFADGVTWFREDSNGVTFAVRVVPRASRSEIAGVSDGTLRVRVAAPPVEGAANRELVKVLAKRFKVSQAAITL